MRGQEIGNCPDCGEQLVRTGNEPGTGKYRYSCHNDKCKNYMKKRFNRHGEPR